MTLSMIYGEAFRDDDADPMDSRIRVYVIARGVRYVGHDSHEVAHVCDWDCAMAALPNEYMPTEGWGISHPRAYVSIHTDERPPFTYARTCDISDFDPGDDPYIECDACGAVLLRDDEAYETMYGRRIDCTRHALVNCSDPDCIRERGGSVLAAELGQAEREIGTY